MTDNVVAWLVTLAGALHFVQLPTFAVASNVLQWKRQMRQLDLFSRQLVVLFGAGITLCVVGLGIVVTLNHGTLLHESTGAHLCSFLSLFWMARGVAQWRVFGSTWPKPLRWVHAFLCVLYPAMGLLYGAGAVHHV